MKILLAGGAGYLGSALAPVLLEHGYEVEVIDLLWFGNYLPPEVKVTEKNLFDCTEEDLEGYDQVIFLAGLSNDPMAEYDPVKNFVHNGALPSYLAFIAKKVGVKRLIYACSCSVYGYTVNQLYSEEDPVTCGYPYGISKLQGERGVLQMCDEEFSVISLRQGTISGNSPRMRMDLLINTMFKTVLTEGRVRIDNPSIWRPVLDIRDAINAYSRAIQAHHSVNGVFNIASDNYTVGQVGDFVQQKMERLTGEKIRLDIYDKKDFRNYKVSIDKARIELSFHPQYSVEDTVMDLFDHREAYGDLNKDEYYNIRVFKKLTI